MLFASLAQLSAKNRILEDLEGGRLSEQDAFQKIHEIDPMDAHALFQLGRLTAQNGDLPAAKRLYWRSVESQPFQWQPFLGLSTIANSEGEEPLSRGLLEIGVRLLLLDEDAVEGIDLSEFPIGPTDEGEPMEPAERLRIFAMAMGSRRDLESPSVTATLRPYRLILHWIDCNEVDQELVDVLLAEREVITTPLLIGLIRSYIEDCFCDDLVVEGAVALLGERGDLTVLLPIVECCSLDDNDFSHAAVWAFDRIVQRSPEASRTALRSFPANLPIECRLSLMTCLVRNPGLDRDCVIFDLLARDLEDIPSDQMELFLSVSVTSMAAVGGKKGLVLAQRIFREHGKRLPRAARSRLNEMLNDMSQGLMPELRPQTASPWTVYDVCSGNALWEDDEEPDDDFLDEEPDIFTPSPQVKPVGPGRNDPCWCGSGKKYKKCHLLQDVESSRTSGQELPTIQTVEGDNFLNARSIYEIRNDRALRSVLSGQEDFVKDGQGYAWLEGEPSESARRVFAHLRVTGGRLVVECHSRRRLLSAKDRISALAGDALHHVRDEFEPLRIDAQ